MRAPENGQDEGMSMKETVILCRHPRFKSWMASISKRLPVDASELRFAESSEDLKSLLSHQEKLVLIDFAWAENLATLIKSAKAQIILLGDVQGAAAGDVWQMRTLCMERAEIHAFIDYSRDAEFYLPVLRSALLARDGADKMSEVKQLSVKLNALVSQNLSELHRLKRLHERLVPMRGEKLKGLSIHSKFAAGESSGGEFFDTVAREKEVLVLLASSRSYIASSAILGHFEELRSKNSFDDASLESFVTALSYELKKLQSGDVELLLFTIDMKTMEIKGYNYGAATIWKDGSAINKANELEVNPNFVEKARIEFKLARGEKVLVRSSGLAKNLAQTDYAKDENWLAFLDKSTDKSAQELLSELFFQLKKNVETDFLKTDASAILIEVDKNAIVQV